MQQILSRIQGPSYVQLWMNRLHESSDTKRTRRRGRRRPSHRWDRDKLLDRTFHKDFEIHRLSLRMLEEKERQERIRSLKSLVEKDSFLEVAFTTKTTSFAEERVAQLLRGKCKLRLLDNDNTENGQNEAGHNDYFTKDISIVDENNNTNSNCSTVAPFRGEGLDPETSKLARQIRCLTTLIPNCPQLISEVLFDGGPILAISGLNPSLSMVPPTGVLSTSCVEAPSLGFYNEPVVKIGPTLPCLQSGPSPVYHYVPGVKIDPSLPCLKSTPNLDNYREPDVELWPTFPGMQAVGETNSHVVSSGIAMAPIGVPMVTSACAMGSMTFPMVPSTNDKVPIIVPMAQTTTTVVPIVSEVRAGFDNLVAPSTCIGTHTTYRPPERTQGEVTSYPARFRSRFRPVLSLPYVMRYEKQ